MTKKKKTEKLFSLHEKNNAYAYGTYSTMEAAIIAARKAFANGDLYGVVTISKTVAVVTPDVQVKVIEK